MWSILTPTDVPSSSARPGRPSRGRALAVTIAAIALFVGACASAAAPAAPAAPAGQPAKGTGATGGDQFGSQAGATAAPAEANANGPTDTAYIVRTGTMTIEVPDIAPALTRARAAIVGLGGYVSASEEANAGDKTIASLTFRFPSDRWEDALAAIRAIATKVVDAKTGSSEVTGQVLDLGARITNLRATESALQAIMAKATKISDILEVQNQLTTVQGQIEQLSTEQAHLRDQAALATLSVVFQTPAIAAVSETSTGWNPGAELDRAAAQILAIGQGLATLGIWLVVVGLPVAIGGGLVLFVVAFIARRLRRRLERVSASRGGPPAVVGDSGSVA